MDDAASRPGGTSATWRRRDARARPRRCLPRRGPAPFPRSAGARGVARRPSPCSSLIAEHARVLGADRQQAVECRDELRMVQRPQARGKAARERFRIARQLVDDRARPFAGEQHHAVRARSGAEISGQRRPGEPSSSSAKQKAIFPGLPCVARSTSPGRPPPTFRTTSCSARPIVGLARLPLTEDVHCRSSCRCARRMGPLTIDHRSHGHRGREHAVGVELRRCTRPRAAASTTGRYSGLQPAITALIATFSTLHSTRSGGTTATTSSGRRVVPSSIA